MNLTALTEQRNQLLQTAGTLMQSEKINNEHRQQFDKIMADVDILDADIARATRIGTFEAEQRSNTRPPRSQPGERIDGGNQAQNEQRAFKEWMRTGHISAENQPYLQREQRDLTVGADGAATGGGVLVPVGFDPQLHTALKSYGQVVGAVRQFNTESGEGVRVSLANDTAQGLSVIGETVAVTESDPSLAGFTSYTDTLTTGLVKVSNQLLQDSAFDVANFIQEQFGQRYYRGLSQMITLGNGSNIQSIVSTSTVGVTAATGDALAPSYGDLVNLYASLDPAYIENASFLLNSNSWALLMKLTDNYGRPLLQADVNGIPFKSLFGRPLLISQQMSNFGANKTPILFGDLAAGYTFRQAGRLIIKRLDERYAELYETGFVGFVRAGGYSTDAGTHPIVNLTTASS